MEPRAQDLDEYSGGSQASTPPYRFPASESELWRAYLKEHGFVVVQDVLTAEQTGAAISMFWDYLEFTSTGKDNVQKVSRSDWRTWTKFGVACSGLIGAQISQSAGAWYVRGQAALRKVFSQIWSTEDLLVSMDAVIIWKPWWRNSAWLPVTEGLHLDQNPFSKEGLCAVQGMVPLYDVTLDTGGLQVVPGSHSEEAQDALRRQHAWWKGKGDWCPLEESSVGEAELVKAWAGDLILWDSRTVHGGKVGNGEGAGPVERAACTEVASRLARLSVPVCMQPRAWASPEVHQQRKEAFQRGSALSHWASELSGSGSHHCARNKNHQPIELTPEQRELL
ncbi:hypothetical protein CYMTET_33608 [Cymbomonas tetramitiformis]|uniref:Phytanoyl-CoA dioxygenase n=1 Tax=Cymbomonas tetramitiformis TaxID=36881 RepID=A0AAE0KR13_9CHLO|nr:hypothetical protein CYMTET_33608 [Cymbomonas tetramitiformis]